VRWPWGRSRRGTGGVTAFIDEHAEIEGRSSFSGTALLNGRFRGEVVSSDTLIIGEKGAIHADVKAAIVIVNGEVVGAIIASDRVELRAHARVVGDVEAPVVVIEEGVHFEGSCRMTKGGSPTLVPARELTATSANR
jgi:cytoskeletal protein CcmA (bactofilin family)